MHGATNLHNPRDVNRVDPPVSAPGAPVVDFCTRCSQPEPK